MIVDSLRYWVEQMHVDGFRFDLASILSRDSSGHPMPQPAGPVGHRIGSGARRHEADRRSVGRGRALSGRQLRRRRLEGMERTLPRRRAQLLPRRRGHGRRVSPTACWAVRKSTATRDAKPRQSINFVTCHDGFSLNDLVSYNAQAQRSQRRGQPRRRRTTTAAGTAASKDRPTTRRSSGCAIVR